VPHLDLPDDLVAFLKEGRQLINEARCSAGQVVLLPLEMLKCELFGVSTQSSAIEKDDPHHGENGCYMVVGVNLVAACDGYDPEGILMWLPWDRRYGTWDSSHLGIHVFSAETTWTTIAAAPAKHINAQLGNWTREQTLVPWPRHVYSKRELYGPRPIELLNDPEFLRTCVPLERSRRALLVGAVRAAAANLQQRLEPPPPDLDLSWDELARTLAGAADRIDAGDSSAIRDTFDALCLLEDGEMGDTVKRAFELVDNWLHG
jgi:hypothetical protein